MKVQWLEQALTHLDQIFYYYYEYSEKAAFSITSEITRTSLLLKDHPQAGQIEPTLTDNPKTYRSIPTYKGLFKLIYYIQNETVYIYAVWSCRQNPDDLTKLTEH